MGTNLTTTGAVALVGWLAFIVGFSCTLGISAYVLNRWLR